MRIGLIRHGVTDWNQLGKIQGHVDIPLNAEGKLQGQRIAAALQPEQWSMIVCSDLLRAKQTAAYIADKLAMVIYAEDQRLRERSFGILEGTTREERIAQWGTARPPNPEGAESDEQLRERGLNVLADLSKRFNDERVLLITHGGWIYHTIAAAIGEYPATHPDNTSLSILEGQDRSWELVRYNDLTHLNE